MVKSKNPNFGPISFIIFVILGIIELLLYLLAYLLNQSTLVGDNVKVAIIIIDLFFAFGAIIIHLTGIILGIVGVFQKYRNKVFAILGIIFNGLMIYYLLVHYIVHFHN